MKKNIKMITFDLDDTFWDNMPTITRAEIVTREWVENKVGKVEWGNFDDFLNLREELIKEDQSIKWDISKLRKEIFRKKLNHITPIKLRDDILIQAIKSNIKDSILLFFSRTFFKVSVFSLVFEIIL